jgi:hypothetical protein
MLRQELWQPILPKNSRESFYAASRAQREALSLIEQLAARGTPRVSPLPRAERKLNGATGEGRSISSEEILEPRREM